MKYLNAKELEGTAASVDGAVVYGADGSKLGTVDGFIVDIRQGRPRHVVVAAGWFIHKHFLLPLGHVALSADRTTLTADITKERASGFPGFDKAEFQKLSGPQLDELDRKIAMMSADVDVTELDPHYRSPDGWENPPTTPSECH